MIITSRLEGQEEETGIGAQGPESYLVDSGTTGVLFCRSKRHRGYHLTPVRMAVIKKTRNDKCWQGCGEIKTQIYCGWECKMV